MSLYGTPTGVPSAAPTTGPPTAGGLKAKAKANPKLVVGAGAVAAVILIAMLSKRNSPPADDAGATTPAATGYDSTANDVYNSIMGQMQTLQTQVANMGKPSTPTPKPPAPKSPVPKSPTPKPKPKPMPKPVPPTKKTSIYTVKAGDNLTRIALQFHLPSWKTVYTANRATIGANPNMVKVGTRLVIPR